MRVALAATLLAIVAAGCGSHGESMHVAHSDERLKTLLHAQAHPTLRQAFASFTTFAAVPIAAGELADDPHADGLLYEVGVFDGKLSVSFVRQYGTARGDIQQVHLEAAYPASTFAAVLQRTHGRRCAGDGCVFRCVFDASDFLGKPCSLGMAGEPLKSVTLWSFDSGRADWAVLVEASPPFRYLAAHGRPLRFAVWQDGAD